MADPVLNANQPAFTTTLDKSSASNATSKSGAATARFSQNFDDFLRLLTTQLQNQDPTEPLDTNQFTQQLAVLSQVEQQIATNKNLEQLLAQTNNQQISNAVSYIGKTVDSTGNQGTLAGGKAEFAYSLPAAADKVTVTITNKEKQVVFNGNGSKDIGKNVVIWDGVNSSNGKTMPAGNYTIAISALDATGKKIEATTYSTGQVSSVDMENGTITLSVGDLQVPLDKVISVRETPIT